MPFAAWKPATSSASVNGRTRITALPWSAWSTASSAVKTIPPLAAPGDAGTPRASGWYWKLGSNVGWSSASSFPASIEQQRLLLRQQALLDHVDRHPHRRLRRPLRAACLEHVERPVLDRELDVLHVLVVTLEPAHDLHQLGVDLGHQLCQLGQVARVPHAGDDVLALRVQEEVAGRLRRAGRLVAGERDARRRRVPPVAEHHLLHVDRRAPVVGDVVLAPVLDRARAVPGVEDRSDRLAQLLARVLWELLAGAAPRRSA